MKHFRFRLESVLALRAQLERQAKERLAQAVAISARCEDAHSEAAERLERARQAGPGRVGETVPAEELVTRQAYLERCELERLEASETAALQEQEVESRRQQLEAAARERELLEKLEDRRRGAHERAEARAEDAALSEVALSSFRRRRHGRAA